jgi:hypothetical protein
MKKEKMVPAQTTIPASYRAIIVAAGKAQKPVAVGYSAMNRRILCDFANSVSSVDKKGTRKFSGF